jgi:general secretion pathway protein G
MSVARNKRTGFTLIELLVAVAILGVLTTVGLGSFQSSQMKSRDAQRKSDLSQIQKALEMYYNDKGGYPLSIPEAGSEWKDASVSGGALYMKSVPGDPRGGSYCYESDGTYYKIYAKLENKKDPKIITPSSSVCTAANGYNYGVSSSNVTP